MTEANCGAKKERRKRLYAIVIDDSIKHSSNEESETFVKKHFIWKSYGQLSLLEDRRKTVKNMGKKMANDIFLRKLKRKL